MANQTYLEQAGLYLTACDQCVNVCISLKDLELFDATTKQAYDRAKENLQPTDAAAQAFDSLEGKRSAVRTATLKLVAGSATADDHAEYRKSKDELREALRRATAR